MGKKNLDLRSERAKKGKPKTIKNVPGVPLRTMEGIEGVLPHKMGDVFLTDREKKDMEAAGLQFGDVVPPKLAEMIEAEKALAQEETATLVPDAKPLKLPRIQDVASLPPDHQTRIKNAVAQFREQYKLHEQAQASEEELSQMSPSVRKAIQEAAGPGIQVIDTRTDEDHARLGTQPAEVHQKPVRLEDLDVKTNLKNIESESESEPLEGDTGHPVEDKTAPTGNCPHCAWPLDQPEPAEPDETDKLNYVQSILGSKRFMKEYFLFDGIIRVVYRSLTLKQSEIALTQLRRDQLEGKIENIDSMWQMMNYRTMLAIDRITVEGETFDIAEAVDNIIDDPPDDTKLDATPLPFITDKLQEVAILKNESIWRLLRDNYRRFNGIVEFLEIRADEKGFWKAVGA